LFSPFRGRLFSSICIGLVNSGLSPSGDFSTEYVSRNRSSCSLTCNVTCEFGWISTGPAMLLGTLK
jgi:hypothetical protein